MTVKSAHTHAADLDKKTAAKAATCTEDGYKNDWYACTDAECKAMLDAEGNEIADNIIPATGHDFTGDFASNGDSTHSHKCKNEGCTELDSKYENCVDESVKDHECDDCGYVMSKHTYEDGVCTYCGAEEPEGFDFSGLFEDIFKFVRFKKTTDDIKTFSILTVVFEFIKNIFDIITSK